MSDGEHTEESLRDRGLARIISFSDGVFAIAITLLVLDLVLPPGTTEKNLQATLAAMWPRYLAFGFTFLVIGLRWGTHHLQFRHIVDYNYYLIGANLLLLLSVVFLPFPSLVLSEFPNSRAASVLYAASIGVAALLSTLLWIYVRAANLVDKHPTETELHKYFLVRFLVLPIMFGLAIILVFVFGSLWPARSVAFAAPVVQFVLAARQMARGASE
jgi:uncharacterized membrane protein